MKLYKLKLINYIGIYNGMGIKEIEIDFRKCKNRIVVIKGDNGSGKSTLFKALNPFSDSSSNLIPGAQASKYIAYILIDGSILHITYTYSPVDKNGTRKTSCRVIREMSDGRKLNLNQNNNVKDAKEVICDLLDIDSGFLTLAQLSSEDRGLADKTPAERKRFINAKISELDAFNEIYKKVTKKSTKLHAVVESLNTKIQSIGDTRSIESNIETLQTQLDILDNTRLSFLVDLNKDEEEFKKMSDVVGGIYLMKAELDKIHSQIDQLHIKGETKESDIFALRSQLETENYRKEDIQKKIKELSSRRGSLSEKIMDKQVKLDSIGDSEELSEIESKIKTLKELKKSVDVRFKSFGFERYEDVSVDEYRYALETLNTLQGMSRNIVNGTDDVTILIKIADIVTNRISGNQYSVEGLYQINEKIESLSKTLDTHYKNSSIAEGYKNIPKDCNHIEDCFFIKDIIRAKKEMLSSKEESKLVKELDKNKKEYVRYKEELALQEKANAGVSEVKTFLNIIKSSYKIITKFPVKLISEDDYELLRALFYHERIGLEIDLQPYREYKNLFIESKSYQKDIDTLEKQYMSMAPNAGLINQLTEDIQSMNKEYSSIADKIDELTSEYNASVNQINRLNIEIQSKTKALENYKKYMELKEEESKIQEKIKDGEDEYIIAKGLEAKINDTKIRLHKVTNEEIPSVQKTINELKYRLILYDDYVKEYAQYSSEFNKIETIRRYCSPTTGIQTLFIEMYMNKIIGISNQLLSMLFRGEYLLQPFVVNEKEFRMPVLGSGILNDDISSMSTSQICMISMILSFSLLHQSSTIYNIIKIDEIEGGLDIQNRSAFFGVLQNLMDTLCFEQCVMISHNAELNMGFMDVIVLKNTDPASNYLEGNVIYELGRD